MATTEDTWDTTDIGAFLKMSEKKNPLLYMYYQILEHDSHTAKKLKEESKHHESELSDRLDDFAAAYKKLRRTLVKATKNSEKF